VFVCVCVCVCVWVQCMDILQCVAVDTVVNAESDNGKAIFHIYLYHRCVFVCCR